VASILFVTWDGGGNLAPALGIAAELRARGDTVRFLGHATQRDAIQAAGFRFESYARARPWSAVEASPGLRGVREIFAMFTDRGPGEDLLATVEREPVDLAVIDCMSLAALKSAGRVGLRRAVLVHTFYEFMARKWSRGPIGMLARLKGLSHPVRLWSAADLVLVTTLADLDPAASRPDLPASIRYTGPVWPAESAATPSEKADRSILVSLSTVHYDGQDQVFQTILDAVADMDVHAVITTGHAVDPDRLRAPANAQLHRYLPHDDVMPKVSLVVGHGGHTTTMRALAHDLPLVIMPMHPMLDQSMIGRAVTAAGAGAVLSRTASPMQVRAAIEQLLRDGPHHQAAARLGTAIRTANSTATAADHIRALASST
jgi:UDP:flavonoid glycosyltransferase YjiC (YdhE family)